MPILIDKLVFTTVFATVFFGMTTFLLWMVSDISKDDVIGWLFLGSFILLCTCPIVALILAIVRIWS